MSETLEKTKYCLSQGNDGAPKAAAKAAPKAAAKAAAKVAAKAPKGPLKVGTKLKVPPPHPTPLLLCQLLVTDPLPKHHAPTAHTTPVP